jgi:hypothetical protein
VVPQHLEPHLQSLGPLRLPDPPVFRHGSLEFLDLADDDLDDVIIGQGTALHVAVPEDPSTEATPSTASAFWMADIVLRRTLTLAMSRSLIA